ncbi:protein KRI1 [Trypanosoma rangeli]|uniref:Protein KRI1 n=1 Tax=Trypanosoma rangeli TaxID=5698 RepID=A0A3R7NCJ6_TRYRA|nr:protein KRI1 [Trypanosoma rangeli]RNF00630.1 protein KRI1 [Trypanosoma rangeli]|eukprot:RNF00630.1 protein KRI1 [Trypanosoma rangeli]
MPKKDLFSSSDDDDDKDGAGSDALAQQMAAAAMRERRRDPHAHAPFTTSEKRRRTAMTTALDDGSSSSRDSDTGEEERPQVPQAGAKAARKPNHLTHSGTSDDDGGGIRINKQYAAKYEEVKRRKELQQLTEKYGKRLHLDELDETDEDDEDDEAVLLTEDKELAFAKAFLAIRRSTVQQAERQQQGGEEDVLGPQSVFFPPTEEQVRENTEVFTRSIAQKREQRKKFTLADEYRRGVVTGVETHASAQAGADGDDGGQQHPQGNRRIHPQTSKEHQLRESFLRNVAESTEAFEVQPVVVTTQQKAEEGEQQTSSEAKRLLEGAFSIRDADAGKTAADDPDESFLRDFFVGELWKPKNNKRRRQTLPEMNADREGNSHEEEEEEAEEEEEENHYAALAELAQAEEDERFYAEAEAWERAYQDRAYRHQEEEADHVQTFPRAIGENAAGILRKSVKSSRKEARLRRLERMKELREQQVAELRRLKTLKRQEIESQRALIASVAGIAKSQESGLCGRKEKARLRGDDNDGEEEAAMARLQALWSEKDLEEEFDPQKFDKKMAQIFDDAYYDENNVDEEEMAFFEEAEEAGSEAETEADGEGNHATDGLQEDGEAVEPAWYKAHSLEETVGMTAAGPPKRAQKKREDVPEVDEALALLYPSAVMQAAEAASLGNGRREHIEHMIQQQKQESAVGQGGGGKAEEALQRLQAELEKKEKEYWQLHHDATLDGGAIKTRFKYRQVAPEDFTLSVEEILSRDDRQLNMLVPMSCYAAYLREDANRRDRMKVERRRQRGFREVAPTRSSRRYGDVAKTALVDANMTEEEGEKWSKDVRGGLRRLRESVAVDVEGTHSGDGISHRKGETRPQQRQQKGKMPMQKKPRYESQADGGRLPQGGRSGSAVACSAGVDGAGGRGNGGRGHGRGRHAR